jgi:ribonuclease R
MRRTRKKNYQRSKPRRENTTHTVVIPERDAVLGVLARRHVPVSLEDLAQELAVFGEAPLNAFKRRLRAMERDGQILRNRSGRYGLIKEMDIVRGHVIGHADGYGFLTTDEPGDDLYLSAREMRQVMHGDRVAATVTGIDARGRKEGSIVEVLERRNQTVVGRYFLDNRIGIVVPEDKRISQEISVPDGEEGDARPGQIVVVKIVDPPTRRRQAVGHVIELLGDHMAPGMEVEVALRKHQLPHSWPDDVSGETAAFAEVVESRAKRGREDLRDLPLVTIDGEDARDFDDAVYCSRSGKGWRLIVAIADVAHYVAPGTALDREAQTRGNSVYFPTRVIPMLPEVLSNGLCSLNPQTDRLCLACELKVGRRGRIKDFRFFQGLMRSHARLTYREVAAMLVDGDIELKHRHRNLVPHLSELYALFKALHQVRIQRGAVDFELPETRFIFDDASKIHDIVRVERNDAHRLIEECMLAANVCAAEFLKKHKIPAPYRVHEGPTAEKLTELREFLRELGLSLGGGSSPRAPDYARLLAAVNKRPESALIQMALLRSLSQALYSPDNIGHFALGYDNYTHFTSPIRRYPDLHVHRAIKRILKKKPPGLSEEEARQVGIHCSMTERRADDATRDVARWLKAEYMMDRVGDEFDGMITGVTSFGIFVELTDIYVDGLVHVSALGNDYYHFDPAKHRLSGSRTRKSYRLGDTMRVRVVRVDLDEARIDLEPVDRARKVRRGPKTRKKSRQS